MSLPIFTSGYADLSLNFINRKLFLVLKPCKKLSWFLPDFDFAPHHDKKFLFW